MNDVLILALLTVATATVWPLNRWAQRHGGTPLGTGIVLSGVALAGGIVGSLVTKQPVYHPAAFFFGALGGLAYAAGFALIILRCLRLGPAGPTALAYGLGMSGTVFAALLVPYSPPASLTVILGLGGAVLTALLLGLLPAQAGQPNGSEGRREWRRLIVGGWAFAALYGATQYLSGRFAPGSPFGYLVAQALVSLLLLLLVASSGRKGRPRGADLIAGAGTGVIVTLLAPASATLMVGMESAAAYPVMAAAPFGLVVLLGATAYRERLTVWGWLACLLGLASLVLLSLPSR